MYSPRWMKGLSKGKESACQCRLTRDANLIPGSGRSPGKGNENLLQYSCWKIPWTEEPHGLQFMGLPRVVHDWATECAHAHIRTHRWMKRLYDILEKAKLWRQSNGQWLPGVGVRGEGQMGYKCFWGQWTLWYRNDGCMSHYMLVQIRIISDISYALQVVMA